MISSTEIEKRKPVWSALSELWLDTELDEPSLRHIARVMYDSGYSLGELRYIHLDEVAHVVCFNLKTPAGEWVNFDDDWLIEQIMASSKPKGRILNILTRVWRMRLLYITEDKWLTVKKYYLELRDAESHEMHNNEPCDYQDKVEYFYSLVFLILRIIQYNIPIGLLVVFCFSYTWLNIEQRIFVEKFGCGCRTGFNTNHFNLIVFAVVILLFSLVYAVRLKILRHYSNRYFIYAYSLMVVFIICALTVGKNTWM